MMTESEDPEEKARRDQRAIRMKCVQCDEEEKARRVQRAKLFKSLPLALQYLFQASHKRKKYRRRQQRLKLEENTASEQENVEDFASLRQRDRFFRRHYEARRRAYWRA